jgi:hypothetical protein
LAATKSGYLLVVAVFGLAWLLMGTTFVAINPDAPSAGGVEALFLNGAEKWCRDNPTNCIGSEPLYGDESLSSGGDHTLSPDATELIGNRSGVRALSSWVGTALSSPVTWGRIDKAIEVNNGPNFFPVSNWRTGALAFDETTQRSCFRFAFEVDSDFSNAGSSVSSTGTRSGFENTAITGVSRCGYAEQDNGRDQPGTNFVYLTATTLRDSTSGADNCLDAGWTASNRPIRTEGPSGTNVGNITNCSFGGGATTLTVTNMTLVDETYTYVGRGCQSCPRNKLMQFFWDGGPVMQVVGGGLSCPVAGSYDPIIINNIGNDSGASYPEPKMALGECKTGFCSIETCFYGKGLDVGNTLKHTSLAANGDDSDFDTDSGNWTGTNWAVSGGTLNHTAGSTVAASITVPSPGVHNQNSNWVVFTVSGRTAGTVKISLGGNNSGTVRSTNNTFESNEWGGAEGNATIRFVPSSDFDGSIDNVIIGGFAITSQLYTDETQTTITMDNGAQTVKDVTGPPSADTAVGLDLFHSQGWASYGSVLGKMRIGTVLEGRWSDDPGDVSGPFMGPPCEALNTC